MRRLLPNGKPMRALRILSDAIEPLDEDDVWRLGRRDMGDTAPWWVPLKLLVDLGYAERHGDAGGYRYTITEEGRKRLQDER